MGVFHGCFFKLYKWYQIAQRSTNNPFGKSPGENDSGYQADFSVNVSQSEIDQSSDYEGD